VPELRNRAGLVGGPFMAAKRCAKCVINWSEEVVGGVAEPTACPQCEGGLVWQAQSVPDSSEGDVLGAPRRATARRCPCVETEPRTAGPAFVEIQHCRPSPSFRVQGGCWRGAETLASRRHPRVPH
jgi:hypothetical protein